MTAFKHYQSYSIVTAIIPQHRANAILSEVFKHFDYGALQFDARGTLVRDYWYQVFLPVMNPENEFLQFIIADDAVDDFMQYLIKLADLGIPGTGAVFSIPCLSLYCNSDLFIHTLEAPNKPTTTTSSIKIKDNLSAVFALVQSGRTESAIRSSIQAGSHGPIVYHAEGRGTRDRVSWLKITKKPYEEVILVLVDNIDKEAVIDAIVNAGRINMPGGGILYDIPVSKGVINLQTSLARNDTLATNHQMVAAIDQLMGNNDWRDNSVIGTSITGKKAHNAKADHSQADLSLLCVWVPRKHVYTLVDAAIAFGAPGANIIYTKYFGGSSDITESGFDMHHDLAYIRMAMPSDNVKKIQEKLATFCTEENIHHVAIYQQSIHNIIRYQSR